MKRIGLVIAVEIQAFNDRYGAAASTTQLLISEFDVEIVNLGRL